ncbi:MAG: SDR family oxidoreductase [Candidatus Eremiobacteraeota bacterium]|nr:SDR family oxidoreductase [Candidatus Eremiobacteraeota bacterium]
MQRKSIANKRALVTGASSGFGADFARELARRGSHLIIVARRTDQLDALAAEIRQQHRVEVDVIGADLSLPTAAQDLYDRVMTVGWAVDILVNNAGFGLYGDAVLIPWSKEQAMLQIDVVTLAGLTKLFLPHMLERRFGYILNVSSIAAFQPTPLYASYAAAKAFVLFYSQALHHELRGSGVSVTALAPGVTATDFLRVSGQQPTAYQRFVMMRSADVVRIGVNAMLAGKATVVPGFLNVLLTTVSAISPRAVSIRVAELLMRSNKPQH